MAKGRRRGRGDLSTPNRVIDPPADDRLSWAPTPIGSLRGPVDLIAIEDRRTYHPDPVAPLRSPRRWRHRLVLPAPQPINSPLRPGRSAIRPKLFRSSIPVFQSSKTLALCVRRKTRREVLLALGKGGGKHKRPRRNKWSGTKCSRS